MCLTLVIYKEARGEGELGKIAVGMVLLNRAENNNITPCRELKLRGAAWSWDKDSNTLSKIDTSSPAWLNSQRAAMTAITWKDTGQDLHGITHFHNPSVTPSWSKKLQKIFVVGNHTFYKEN